MTEKSLLIKRMTGTAMLAALIVIFQVIGNYIAIGPVSINLSLLPIAIGAILYGPWAGLFLGIVNGFSVMPSSAFFFGISAIGTIICCLLKTGLAGLISGLIFKLFKGKGTIPGMFVSSIIIPIINTGVFTIFAMTLFKDGLVEAFTISGAISETSEFASYFFLGFIGINFIFEFSVSLLLSPSIVYVIKMVTKNYNIGDNIGDRLYKKAEVIEDGSGKNE